MPSLLFSGHNTPPFAFGVGVEEEKRYEMMAYAHVER
jgi:hypothetical protein